VTPGKEQLAQRRTGGGRGLPLSVVVLSRNEERCIGEVLESLLANVGQPFEVLVVDDSVDGTARIIQGFSAAHECIRLVRQEGRGYTAAVMTGVAHARYETLAVLVADASDDAGDIETMRAKMAEGYDLVCASRYMRGGSREGGHGFTGACSRIVCVGLRALTGIATHDASNSFKMYRTGMLRSMDIEEAGYATSMQAALKAHFGGLRITEIPTTWRDRGAGASKFLPRKEAEHYAHWLLWAIAERLRRGVRGKRRRDEREGA